MNNANAGSGTTTNLPGILLSTLPKSATVYIWAALAHGLGGLPQVRVTACWFPVDLVSKELLPEFVRGGNAVAHAHLGAQWQNRILLSHYLDKMIVHVRDPRSSALEWVHHMLTMKHDGQDLGIELTPKKYWPEGFFEMSYEEQIEVEVHSFLPDAIQWIESWLDAIEDPSFKTKVHLTQYEKFVADEKAYFHSVLDFYGIDKSLWTFKPYTPQKADDPRLESAGHFRNARLDEWRDAFTPDQIERAAGMMPERLFERFGWPRT